MPWAACVRSGVRGTLADWRGSLGENGCSESFNSRMKTEVAVGEIFDSIRETKVLGA